jgi:hypothetical protein
MGTLEGGGVMKQEAWAELGELPHRKEITLCEAVTAVAIGAVNDAFDFDLKDKPLTDEQKAKVGILIEHLRNAAYAGRIKFRAHKTGDEDTDTHREIDHLYFRRRRGFRWECDEIWSQSPSLRNPTFEERPGLTKVWYGVHVDREQFAALLLDTGVSVQQIFKSGFQGRPTSRHLIGEMAQDRLDAENYPKTLSEFSRQLEKELRSKHPNAAPATAKTIANLIRAAFRSHTAQPKPINPPRLLHAGTRPKYSTTAEF